jgi:uncharacterized membrane protein
MRIDSWVYDLLFILFTLLMLREGRIIFGRSQASMFLWGSLLWTGIIENMNVVIGGYDYFAYADYYSFQGHLIKGYGGWVSWILFVPLAACLGWFLLSFPAFMISVRLFTKRSIWLKSTFAAVMLVCFDLFYDPMAVVNEWWRWTCPGTYIHGMPLQNSMGWFFLLFFYGAIYERTVVQMKGFRWLSRLERMAFRQDTSELSGMELVKVGRIFYFRLLAFLPVFFAVLGLVGILTMVLFNNRWGEFNNIFPNPFYEQFSKPPGGTP